MKDYGVDNIARLEVHMTIANMSHIMYNQSIITKPTWVVDH